MTHDANHTPNRPVRAARATPKSRPGAQGTGDRVPAHRAPGTGERVPAHRAAATSERVPAHRPQPRAAGTGDRVPAHQAPAPARGLALVAGGRPATPVSARHAPVQAPVQAQRPTERVYMAVAEGPVREIQPMRTAFFDTVNQVKAMTVATEQLPARQSLAQRRGYSRDDLLAVAEVAYHYLFNGGTKLALTLYEGLHAVAPEEAYFALALGLTHDHLGHPEEAWSFYEKAAALDPSDGRADVNRAELLLERGDLAGALRLLASGAAKARSKGDQALEKKAVAMHGHLQKRSAARA